MEIVKRALLLTFFLLISFPAVSYAQPSEFHMSLAPSKLELTLGPGTSTEFQIHLDNFSNESQNLKVYSMDYYITEKNSVVFLKPGHFSYSCATWISTDSPKLDVPGRGNAASSTAAKTFSVSVPPNAEPGGHYAVIIFQQPAVVKKGVPVKISGQIGALIMITVPGAIIRNGDIKSVSVNSSWLWPTRKFFSIPHSPTRYKVVFQNTGNVHITVRGKLTYKPTFGWGSATINLAEMTVLPGTIRDFEGTIPNPPLFGSYKVRVEMYYGPSLDVFDTTKTKSCEFDSFPVLALVLLLLVLPGVIITLVILIKRWLGKEVSEEEEEEEKKEKETADVEERSWESFEALWDDKQEKEPEEEKPDNGGTGE